MRELWRDRRFRFLLNIVDGLPQASHLGQAVADDDEMVNLHEAGSGPVSTWRPTVRHHDEAAVILSAIQAGIENLISATAEKYKPNFVQPPLTAYDRAVAKDRRRKIARVHELFSPR